MSNIKRFGIVNQEVLKDPELSIQVSYVHMQIKIESVIHQGTL
jgi:hypothetical protein